MVNGDATFSHHFFKVTVADAIQIGFSQQSRPACLEVLTKAKPKSAVKLAVLWLGR